MAETDEKKDNGSWLAVFIVVTIIAIGVGIGIKNITGSEDQSPDNEGSNKIEDKYMDAMRKCTVMEAVDIYNTGIGGDKDDPFGDARKTCSSWYRQWEEKDFYDSVYEDWENRKNEVIEGKNLEYYLNVLGW